MAPQKAPIKSSGKSQEKNQVEELIQKNEALMQQNQSLAIENYTNSLADDKTFRLELLQTLTKINMSLESLNHTILDGLLPISEEENPEEEKKEVEAPEEEATEVEAPEEEAKEPVVETE